MPHFRFKIGDMIRIKEGLDFSKAYNGITILASMAKHGGETYQIESIDTTTFSDRIAYRLQGIACYWPEDTLEPYFPFEVGDYIVGNKLNTYNVTGCGVLCKVLDINIERNKMHIKPIFNLVKEKEEILFNSSYSVGNLSAFDLVKRKEKVEMTVAEIEKKLGYPIKIVKEF